MVRGGLVIIVVVIVVVIVIVFCVEINKGKVYFAAGGCRLCVKVNVGEEETASTCANGGRLETGAVPVYIDAVVVNAKVVGSPVDERVGLGQPGFAKKEVVIFERVDKRIKVGGVLLSCEGDLGSVGRKGSGAVWESDGNGGGGAKRYFVLFYKRRANDISLSSAVD